MVYIIRCMDIVSDPRAMKYVKFLQDSHISYKLIAWDREGKIQNDDSNYYFKKLAGYNVGGGKAIINRILWMVFVFKTLVKIRDKKLVLHGCDLDAVFPSVLYKMIFSRKTKVIFDVFDWYSATLYNQSKIVLKAFSFMERISVKYSDNIIICEPERINQIQYTLEESKVSILPNIPYFSETSFLNRRKNCEFDNEKLTFSYVGGFSNERCINEIIEIAKRGVINLLIAGYGIESISARLKELYKCPSIKYYGKVNYTDALSIMYNSDVIYAMYSISNPNHIYAAPNKFYEAMFLGKPIFTTKGTIVEKKVKDAGIGYISGENIEEILAVIKNIEKGNAKEKGLKAKCIWNETFKSYTQNFMLTDYMKMITAK